MINKASKSTLDTLKKLNKQKLNKKFDQLIKHKYNFDYEPYNYDKLYGKASN